MAGYILLGTLASFGLVCMIWALVSLMIAKKQGGAVVYLCHGGLSELPGLRRWLWLRNWGLMTAPILLVDCGLTDQERKELCLLVRNGEFCDLEVLPARLELERIKFG